MVSRSNLEHCDVSLSPRLRARLWFLDCEASASWLTETITQPLTPLARLPSALSVVLFVRTRCTLGSDPRSALLSADRASKRSSSPIPSRPAQSPRRGTGGCLELSSLSPRLKKLSRSYCALIERHWDCRLRLALIKRIRHFSPTPQSVQQHGSLPSHRHRRSLLGVLASSLRQFQAPAPQGAVCSKVPQ